MVLVAIAVAPVGDARAIVVRDDVPDAAYVVDDADYPAVVTLFPPDDCAGTLVHAEYLLTVAHCAVDLVVGDSLEVAGTSHAIADVWLHPKWDDGDEYDVAVVRFTAAVQGVAPVPIHRGSDELGAVVEIVGRGVTATGLVGERGGKSDGRLRRATNVVSAVDDLLFEVTFERPGEAGVTDLEGVGASGDSGGPVFLEIDGVVVLAGLNAFGDAPDGIGIAQYGAWDVQTRVSAHAAWIDDVLAGLVEPTDLSADDGCACTLRQSSRTIAPLVLLVVVGRRRAARAITGCRARGGTRSSCRRRG